MPRRLFARSAWAESGDVVSALRTETVGGALLLAGAAVALLWANSPWDAAYDALLSARIGPEALHLDLDVRHWAADGLLAVFFFVAGIELKREFVTGELRDPAKAVLPVAAAVAGVVLPAALYLAVTAGDPTARGGWAIPVATDIAFALAVLAVLGSHLPPAMRAFLLTLAVVDDLIAIVIIAVAYTDHVDVVALLGALLPLAAFGVLARRGITSPWLLLPAALATWAAVHASGVHATVAGVLLALTLPATARAGADHSVAERVEHKVRPWSAGVAVPLFALTAAGVTLRPQDVGGALRDPVVAGVVVALVVGKSVGVLAGTYLTARFTRAELDEGLAWSDVAGLALLAGIGFTVSLLLGELSFGATGERADHVRLAVIAGSLVAAAAAAVILRRRNRTYRQDVTRQDVTRSEPGPDGAGSSPAEGRRTLGDRTNRGEGDDRLRTRPRGGVTPWPRTRRWANSSATPAGTSRSWSGTSWRSPRPS